jgi:TonB family protein
MTGRTDTATRLIPASLAGFLPWAACLLFGLIAVPAAAEPAVRARSLQPLATYFSDEDYPAAALRAGEQGIVAFRLRAGPDGKPSGCTILSSSGSSSLDSTTCRILMERPSFEPARDAQGKATSDEFVGRIVWKLPETAPQPRQEAALMLWTGCIMGEATKLVLTDLPPDEIARRSFPPCAALEALYSREIGKQAPLEEMRTQLTPMIGMMLVEVRKVLNAPAERNP